MIGPCPGPAALERAFPASASEELTRHVASCESCRAQWEALESMASLVRDMPVENRTQGRVDALRDSVLAAAARRTQQPRPSMLDSRRVRASLALAAMLAVVALVVTLRSLLHVPAEPAFRASVVAGTAARFTHQALPDEQLRLIDGTISLDVEHLREGERLRVVTGDAEVEVRGTSFVVEAHDDRLSWVHVSKGRVEVRVKDHAPVMLGALEHWRPEPPVGAMLTPVASPVPVRTAIAVAKTPPTIPATTPAPAGPDLETPYREAWAQLKRGDVTRAAAGFEQVLRADPSGALASDAAYWRAVALARAGKSYDSKAALREFLQLFPDAPEAGEASAMLGWLLVDEGDLDGARRAFERAQRLGPEAVGTSAEEGLRAVDALGAGSPR